METGSCKDERYLHERGPVGVANLDSTTSAMTAPLPNRLINFKA